MGYRPLHTCPTHAYTDTSGYHFHRMGRGTAIDRQIFLQSAGYVDFTKGASSYFKTGNKLRKSTTFCRAHASPSSSSTHTNIYAAPSSFPTSITTTLIAPPASVIFSFQYFQFLLFLGMTSYRHRRYTFPTTCLTYCYQGLERSPLSVHPHRTFFCTRLSLATMRRRFY